MSTNDFARRQFVRLMAEIICTGSEFASVRRLPPSGQRSGLVGIRRADCPLQATDDEAPNSS